VVNLLNSVVEKSPKALQGFSRGAQILEFSGQRDNAAYIGFRPVPGGALWGDVDRRFSSGVGREGLEEHAAQPALIRWAA